MKLQRVQGRMWLMTLVGMLALLLVVVGSRMVPVSAAAPSVPALQPGDWPTYLHDLGRSGYDPTEKTITATSAAKLKLHWTKTAGGLISVQPMVYSGNVVWGAWGDGIERQDTSTGSQVWAANVGVSPPVNCGTHALGVSSTATKGSLVLKGVTTPVVFVGGGDVNFYALNAKTGSVIWKTPLGTKPSYYIWGSPAFYNGNIYMGVSSRGDCPLVPGQIVELNGTTGQIMHSFSTTPKGCTGASIWGSPTIDTAVGTLYFVTGNGGNCTNEPYATAMIELRASDLSLVGSWQVPPSQQVPQGDGDFGSTPTLFTATINKVTTNIVGVPNKNGIYYAFKRDAIKSGPLWFKQIAVGGQCPECGNGSISPSAWDGTRLYVAGGNTKIGGKSCPGSVRAVNPATGAYLWEHCAPGMVLGAVSAVPGVLFIGGGSSLVAINSTNGAQLFSYNTGAQIYGPPSISNGMVYVGSTNNKMYAFGM